MKIFWPLGHFVLKKSLWTTYRTTMITYPTKVWLFDVLSLFKDKTYSSARKFLMVLVSLSCPLSAAEMMPESLDLSIWFLFWLDDPGVIKEGLKPFFMVKTSPWSQSCSCSKPMKAKARKKQGLQFHCQAKMVWIAPNSLTKFLVSGGLVLVA